MATFEGIPVTTAMVPIEITKAVPIDVTTDQFKARLKQGGTLELIGNDLTIGEPNFGENKSLFMALDALELRKGARIITNGNFLTVFVNRLTSENGKILSFLPAQQKASTGGNGDHPGDKGEPGIPGDGGGFVSIHVIQELDGILHVDLHGQDGGDGGHGAAGAKGVRGPDGQDSHTGPGTSFPFFLTCVREAQPGHRGGAGGAGGPGGPGGPGGHGGIFQLINIGANPIPEAKFTFAAPAGRPGSGGNGGAGGEGGDGGSGGRGSLQCHGANGGPHGDRGPNGEKGVSGATAADGKAIVKNLDLEIVVRLIATPTPTPISV